MCRSLSRLGACIPSLSQGLHSSSHLVRGIYLPGAHYGVSTSFLSSPQPTYPFTFILSLSLPSPLLLLFLLRLSLHFLLFSFSSVTSLHFFFFFFCPFIPSLLILYPSLLPFLPLSLTHSIFIFPFHLLATCVLINHISSCSSPFILSLSVPSFLLSSSPPLFLTVHPILLHSFSVSHPLSFIPSLTQPPSSLPRRSTWLILRQVLRP